MRYLSSEALGLRRSDIDLRTRRVSMHEEYGRTFKRESHARELSIPAFTYWPARKAWSRVCKAAGIVAATIHDARHTFAVHAVQGGVPEARLQKLLSHAHPATTRRYAMHSPEQFQDADADRVASHMGLAAVSLRLERQA
jgi:integrase